MIRRKLKDLLGKLGSELINDLETDGDKVTEVLKLSNKLRVHLSTEEGKLIQIEPILVTEIKDLRCKALSLMQQACSDIADVDGDNSVPYKTDMEFLLKCRKEGLNAFIWDRKEQLREGCVVMSPETEDNAWKVRKDGKLEGVIYMGDTPTDLISIEELLDIYDEPSYYLIVVENII